ncbi:MULTISPECIES: biopolymer transporter ExbD [Bartonella]|uniref:biopolymer transporter ExbD n=1 Tax=Bartonella TaxID=773 RepID=UPI0011A68232|nr:MULTISPECIES: biopolymer transporter ExbD [Bartonella]
MKADFNDHWDCDESGLHSEINVTPFIDVVLVLLIVFMVAAPLATSVIPVQLPSITQAPLAVQPDEPLYITLQKDHALYVGEHLVSQTTFVESLLKETKQNRETKILIKADSEIDYGAVVDLLNHIRTAGYTKVGLMGLQKSSSVMAKEAASDAIVNTPGVAEDTAVNVTKGVVASPISNGGNTNPAVMGTVDPLE